MLSWDKTPALAPMRCCRAWVEINLSALAHNVRTLKALLPAHADLMSVVKADAYGHGAVTVSRVALNSGATWLGVATVPEGIELRQAGITAPILVMGAVNAPEEVCAIARWQLQPTIVNPKQALIFSETLAQYRPEIETVCSNSGGKRGADNSSRELQAFPRGDWTLPVHLKLDTGMSRLGFRWQQAVELARFVKQLAHLEITSVYSHLATADSPDPSVMLLQHERFERAIADLKQAGLCPPRLHLANSAATLVSTPALPLHYDMVRAGLATYGLYPAPHLQGTVTLNPVLEVKARITHLKTIEPGSGVSYNHKFVAKQSMKIAIVGIGYADGVPRKLSNQLEVVVNGQLVRQIGAITMDQLMLDVSDLDTVQEGDIVTLLGEAGGHRLSAEHWAELTETISWEILCGFKHRMPRIEVSNSIDCSPQAVEKPAKA
ncbi:MAG: alanine racemase [Cyanobacteria bacterium P01_F01_bin.53]